MLHPTRNTTRLRCRNHCGSFTGTGPATAMNVIATFRWPAYSAALRLFVLINVCCFGHRCNMKNGVLLVDAVKFTRTTTAYLDGLPPRSLGPPILKRSKKTSVRYFEEYLLVPPLRPLEDIGNDQSVDMEYRSKLPISYTNDPKAVSRWLDEHVQTSSAMKQDGCCILGFDTESVPDAPWVHGGFRGTATIQLATTDASLVVQLARNNGRKSDGCIPIIEAVLRDENIIKAGVSIDDDMVDLRHCFPGLEARSRLDLGQLSASKAQTPGLKKLTGYFLGLELMKSKKIATSDWSHVPLTEKQILYSARDAWVGAAITDKLQKLDPEAFNTPSLVQILKSQASLEELERKRIAKKQAKTVLSILRLEDKGKHSIANKNEDKRTSNKIPTWKLQLIRELKAVVKEANQKDVFDIVLPVNKREHARSLNGLQYNFNTTMT